LPRAKLGSKRNAALADHGLETPLLGYSGAKRDSRAAEALQEDLQPGLALNQRLRTEIATVERQKVERPQVDTARLGPTHVHPGSRGPPRALVGRATPSLDRIVCGQ
jgi:hypothetical protein